MDSPTRASEAAAGGDQGGAAPAREQPRRGAHAGRRVSERQGQTPGPSVGEQSQAAGGAGPSQEGRGIGSRRVSTVPEGSGARAPGAAVQHESSLEAASVREAQPGALPQERPAAESHRRGELPERERVFRALGLPWLTAEQNAQRGTMDRRLEQIWNREEIPPRLKDELSGVANSVSATERLVLDAHTLLQRSGTELLTVAGWEGSGSSVSRLRAGLGQDQLLMRARLERSAEGDALPPEAGSLLRELQQRLDSALRYLNSDDAGWDAVVRHVEARLPIPAPSGVASTTGVEVHSIVVPGTALGTCFVEGYPAGGGRDRFSAARYMHVHGLAQTVLNNSSARTLYSGLRHGIIDAEELDGPLLAVLPDEDLQSLVGEFIFGAGDPVPAGRTRARQINDRCGEIRESTVRAASDAVAIRMEACKHMATESALAALVTEPRKLGRALAGNVVEVRLFALSLLTRDDYNSWCAQQRAFAELDQEGPVELQVCGLDADGAAQTVQADIRVRQFVLAAGDQTLQPWAKQVGDDAVEMLLGPRHAPDLGGAIKASLDAKAARLARLSDRFVTMDQDHSRLVQERGANHPDARELEIKILELQQRRFRVEKRTHTLGDVGKQLKAMWIEAGELPRGREAHRMAAARLALAGRLMRETPVLICKSGRDFTRQLDPQIKFLATVADSLHGHLPLVEAQMETWKEARRAFSPQ